MAQLEMRDLQLGPLATDDGPVLAPIELECLASAKHERHERATAHGLLDLLTPCRPGSRECRYSVVRPLETQRDQIGVHLLERTPLFARLGRLRLEPSCKLLRERIEFAWTSSLRVLRLDGIGSQVLLDRISRQAGAPGYLSDRQLLSQCPTPDHTQCRHVNHS
jgi:hypothetical protein